MQFFAILSVPTTILSVCAAVTIPLVPGNNEHYIEGKSRWIWMGQGERGPLTLVDLLEPADDKPVIDGSYNQYWLFTRKNMEKPDILVYQDKESVRKSNFRRRAPVTVIAHGWWSDGTGEISTSITSAFLDTIDANVIVIDWRNASKLSYTKAVKAVPSVGEFAGKFLNWLLEVTRTKENDVHMMGHCLGAHVVGYAGNVAKGVARVTGLDPAGPLWHNNPNKLNTSSGVYVETINTDGKSLGYYYPLGHANFYPNRGTNAQPGCLISPCSHSRAYKLFEATVRYNHKVGKKCKDLDEAANDACQGKGLSMGNGLLFKTGEGIYGLSTGNEWPFL